MASTSRIARSAGRRVLHFLFPSWRRTIVALLVEVAGVLAHLPAIAHAAVAVLTHVLLACLPKRRS